MRQIWPVPPFMFRDEESAAVPKRSQITPQPPAKALIQVQQGSLMDRVVSILEQARANVARSVNSNMVIAYWLIGREIVEALQSGGERAEYGEGLLDDLSEELSKRYGRGFSVTNLRYFRLFYQTFSDRNTRDSSLDK
jgi:hypothetical protein